MGPTHRHTLEFIKFSHVLLIISSVFCMRNLWLQGFKSLAGSHEQAGLDMGDEPRSSGVPWNELMNRHK